MKSSKPSSATSNKTINISQKSKKPTIVKCFICNHMFYTQQTFDTHMDQHQKKVNKNLPDQIQRKTMESFGIKRKQSLNRKNTTLEAINQNQISEKISLSNTLKNPIIRSDFTQVKEVKETKIASKLREATSIMGKKSYPKMLQATMVSLSNKQQSKKQIKEQFLVNRKQADDKQIEEIDLAIKQSQMIMSQINLITERTDYSYQITNLPQDQSEQQDQIEEIDKVIQKTIVQTEFIKKVKQQNISINKLQEDILKTSFNNNKSLENCQIQIEYLKKLQKLSLDPKSLQKINKIKSKILIEVISIVNNFEQKDAKQKIQTKQKKAKKDQISRVVNQQPRNCSECFDMIGYGQKCILINLQTYHQGCFSQ